MVFDWDEGNVSHIVDDHGVWPEQVVEALYSRPVTVSKGIEGGEFRIRVVSRTSEGLVLTVVYTYRGDKIRVVTAFESGPAEIRKYEGRWGKYVE
jgi:uncharacterized DUF497 family protein